MRGYPDDDRSDQQRSRYAASVVGDVEYLAGRVVARLTGEHVVIQDNGSSDSMPDIRIDYADRPAGYVEVSVDIDRRYAAMSAAVAKQRHEQGYGFAAPGLGRVWWAWTSGSCRVGKLVQELPRLLAAMQTDGEVFEIRARHEDLRRDPSPNVRRALALGIVGLASRPAGDGEHGAVKLVPQGIGGPVDVTWKVFLDWIKEVLASPKMADVRRKLAASGAPERHVFWAPPSPVRGVSSTRCPTSTAASPRFPRSCPSRSPICGSSTRNCQSAAWSGSRSEAGSTLNAIGWPTESSTRRAPSAVGIQVDEDAVGGLEVAVDLAGSPQASTSRRRPG